MTELANSLLKVSYTKYISWIGKMHCAFWKQSGLQQREGNVFSPPLGTLNVWLEMSFYFKRFWQPWHDQKPRVGRLGQFWLVPSLQGTGAIQRRAAETHGVMAWWRGPSKVCRLSIVGFIGHQVTSRDIIHPKSSTFICKILFRIFFVFFFKWI